MAFTVKSKKWYGKVWPPERRKVKLMQSILDMYLPQLEDDARAAAWEAYMQGVTVEEIITK